MKFNLRNLVLSSAALCATTAFAATQTRLDVPFDFTVKNHAYHAGSYRVEIDPSSSMLKLSNLDELSQQMIWIGTPAVNDSSEPKVRLTFDVVGAQHMLRTIQYGGVITPNLDKRPKHSVEGIATVGE
jgi:hypothetical protein